MRDGQTSPHSPGLVVSRSTCPPISPPPHANSFVLGPAVINTHTLVFDLSITHDRIGSSCHVQQKGSLSHTRDLDAPLCIAAHRKLTRYRQQYADNQNISFLPAIVSTSCRMHGEFLRLLTLFYKPTGRPRRASLQLECHRKTTLRTRSVSSARGIPSVTEEQRD